MWLHFPPESSHHWQGAREINCFGKPLSTPPHFALKARSPWRIRIHWVCFSCVHQSWQSWSVPQNIMLWCMPQIMGVSRGLNLVPPHGEQQKGTPQRGGKDTKENNAAVLPCAHNHHSHRHSYSHNWNHMCFCDNPPCTGCRPIWALLRRLALLHFCCIYDEDTFSQS